MVVCPVHVLEHVVDGHDIRARQVARYPEKVWDVYQFAMQALDYGAELEIPPGRRVRFKQRDTFEIGG